MASYHSKKQGPKILEFLGGSAIGLALVFAIFALAAKCDRMVSKERPQKVNNF